MQCGQTVMPFCNYPRSPRLLETNLEPCAPFWVGGRLWTLHGARAASATSALTLRTCFAAPVPRADGVWGALGCMPLGLHHTTDPATGIVLRLAVTLTVVASGQQAAPAAASSRDRNSWLLQIEIDTRRKEVDCEHGVDAPFCACAWSCMGAGGMLDT